MYVDSHQHFWELSRGDYSWLSKENKPLYRNFFPENLIELIKEKNISKTVIVQAADTVAETEFILGIADNNEFVAGVVGWVNFENKNVKNDIDRLAQNKFLKGFRPMIHDIVNDNWMLKDNISEGINYLVEKNLTFDALVRPQHLNNLINFAKKYPNLPIVIDHIAKPKIVYGEIEKWKDNMKELSHYENVYCKFSGILTEVGKNYTKSQIDPYVEFIFEVFTPKKLMWGSDWPVLTIAENYSDWFNLAMNYCNILSNNEKLDIFSNTAINFYSLTN